MGKQNRGFGFVIHWHIYHEIITFVCYCFVFILDNTRPYFFTNQSYLLNVSNQMSRPVVLDLRKVVGDQQDSIDKLRFEIETNINDTDYILGKYTLLQL